MTSQINELRSTFGALQTMDPDGMIYRRLCNILDRADDNALVAIYHANIKFVSRLAFNRMIRRGVQS
jgi:hypothetical protein